jgi:hypothetical protein
VIPRGRRRSPRHPTAVRVPARPTPTRCACARAGARQGADRRLSGRAPGSCQGCRGVGGAGRGDAADPLERQGRFFRQEPEPHTDVRDVVTRGRPLHEHLPPFRAQPSMRQSRRRKAELRASRLDPAPATTEPRCRPPSGTTSERPRDGRSGRSDRRTRANSPPAGTTVVRRSDRVVSDPAASVCVPNAKAPAGVAEAFPQAWNSSDRLRARAHGCASRPSIVSSSPTVWSSSSGWRKGPSGSIV